MDVIEFLSDHSTGCTLIIFATMNAILLVADVAAYKRWAFVERSVYFASVVAFVSISFIDFRHLLPRELLTACSLGVLGVFCIALSCLGFFFRPAERWVNRPLGFFGACAILLSAAQAVRGLLP